MELVDKLGKKLDDVEGRRWRANLTHKITDDVSYLMDRIHGFSGWIQELTTMIFGEKDSLQTALMDTNPRAMELGYSECERDYNQSMRTLTELRSKFLEIFNSIKSYREAIHLSETNVLKKKEAMDI
jgi:hypothetical protein